MKIGIIVDSSTGLTQKEAHDRGWGFIPIGISVGIESFRDGIDVDQEWAINKFKEGKILTTSQPSTGDILAEVDRMLLTHDVVFIFPLAKGISSTYDAMCNVAKSYDGRVRIVNTMTTSWAIEWMCQQVEEFTKTNSNPDEVELFANGLKDKTSLLGTAANLDAIKRSGRISKVGALLGTIIKIKPVMNLYGEITLAGKERGLNKCYKRSVAILQERGEIENFYLAGFDADDNVLMAKQFAEDAGIKDVIVKPMTTTLGTNLGLGSLLFIATYK